MRASTFAHIRPGGVLGPMRCEPPLTLRQVHGEPGVCALCLVGTAAGPLPGDVLALELCVDPDARAVLTATGASIAQGHGDEPATLAMSATVGAGAELHADPGPLIVAEGSRVDVALTVSLAADASLEWHELVVLGRSYDSRPGRATVRWDVERDGRPVLRQAVEFGVGNRHRVVATALVTAPDLTARTVVLGPTTVGQRVDDTTMLATVLGHDAAGVRRELSRLLAGISGRSCSLPSR